ncbi:hypothetical protein [Cyclobacterium sp.]|uniref:hypothetical protein n=1 Tax=Cyclobacterium sp. TaxID=1966343 RepID=UPI0019AD8453|nr:hypothetical protein [Cyclobacterium sp.]MBD3629023.1 hypothetical protein [Cyclobacterium sp.]
MMQVAKNSRFLKGFWIFMALYLLNCSVDAGDENPNHLPEDLSINDQESMIEIVLEIGLGIEDAIPESEDADGDQETSHKKKLKSDMHFFVGNKINSFRFLDSLTNRYTTGHSEHIPSVFFKVPSPPPRYFC